MYKRQAERPTGKVIVEWDIEGGYDEDDFDGEPSYDDLGLPEIVAIPDEVMDEYNEQSLQYGHSQAEQLITDWLSDEYGFCHFGWSFVAYV